MDEIKQNSQENNDVSAPTPKTEPSDEEKLAETKKQRDEYLAGWQRAKADFLNYKKDEARRFEELIRFANEDILEEFIGVLDRFDLALAALEKAGPVE